MDPHNNSMKEKERDHEFLSKSQIYDIVSTRPSSWKMAELKTNPLCGHELHQATAPAHCLQSPIIIHSAP